MRKENHIVQFPFNANKHQGMPQESDSDLIQSTKLIWARHLNRYAKGEIDITEKQKAMLRTMNEICIRNGHSPMDLPF